MPLNTYSKKPCQDIDRSPVNTVDRFAGFGTLEKSELEAPPKVMKPFAKVILGAMRMHSRNGRQPVSMSDGAIARGCGLSRPTVIAGLRRLLELGKIERDGEPVKQIQAYKVSPARFEKERAQPASSRSAARLVQCGKCKLGRKMLNRAGLCRGCAAEVKLDADVKQAVAELGTSASPEQIAAHLRLGKLAARIERMIQRPKIARTA